MLAAERREHLLDLLGRTGKIVAKDVAAELGISEDSVRRDLRDLATEGLCQRVYGGALPVSPAVVDYDARQAVAPDGKRKVAAVAAALVRPGGSVILDGGTTALAVARALPKNLACTVITHSPTIATALIDHPRADLFLLGGRVFKHSAVTCGAAAVEAAQNISADLCLLGVTGVHPEAGLTTGDVEEAAMKRALSARAADTYVLASSEKIGTASSYHVLPWAKITGLISDTDPHAPVVERLRALGVDVLIAA
ncbi:MULTISPECIES: DeoR/GlpR family DNA-binding transcription regulator [Streptomyces]|uniref:Lactose phosphotransferase system repressor n=1 Tax=Streptomyces griseus subsp. griseus (strain JCM 4626 / CBS 651.72 / NBRC 13350 / KCC S-0626 / ISP 5235) TaxID=455632 RepID=B1VU87_STRGG|nr:DeoR/GlpR family DNA-binding transcription regulator [Streptomyces griseus]MBW3708030.1 DeoR/GlpR transcriptional regulator [Streptomyces griseus]BAG17931.1 putative DeoR-family transcriptional regulator [Streptomyces griseus subsp. griseus NBRC 13350]SED62288.1 DNA-binding transcriptional regulator of sugar metabolism, DeoR/GlpR family [Streptomyces griseus]SQA22693.1 DeoR family transcriptional regulator [Streptomyces griseus]